MMDDKPCKSTPTKDLEDRIMNPNIPKSEAEWWAKNKIEELQWKITERLSLIAPELEKARKWRRVKEIADGDYCSRCFNRFKCPSEDYAPCPFSDILNEVEEG